MPYLLCYTKQGQNHYRDVNDAMHLAISRDGVSYTPLLRNTAVLFPLADLDDGSLPGCTKTMLSPFLFRFADGSGGVAAIQRNKADQPDSKYPGCITIYRTMDFVEYHHIAFLKAGVQEIKSPCCAYDTGRQAYLLEWETLEGRFKGYTKEFSELVQISPTEECTIQRRDSRTEYQVGIPHAVPGNQIEITEDEAAYLERMLGEVYHCETTVPELILPIGTKICTDKLPKAVCGYNDGSKHKKRVKWDQAALEAIDTAVPGAYEIPGEIEQKLYPVPFIQEASDPCVFHYRGKYYFTSSAQKVVLRESDTIDGLREVPKTIIYEDPNANFWAQEIHMIKDVPYIFTSLCPNDWTEVQSILFRCNGEIGCPEDWEGPIYVEKKDGTRLHTKGISLDMTYFELDGIHYVSWSNRVMNPIKDTTNEGGSNGTADIFIATIDPDTPWRLTSDPVCICRPDYGWDRLETEVDEGPYLLRHGDDLFITFSGASVGTVYCVGLLHAKYGSDLLDPSSWKKVPYPVLTKESMPGQLGPGHNNFFKDPIDGEDDYISLNYRPLAEWYEATYSVDSENPRHAALRRVHWNANGYPNLVMRPEQDLSPEQKHVCLKLTVR